MRRGALTQAEAEFLGVWIPKDISKKINQAVQLDDTDRSKFVRSAIREKIARRRSKAAARHNHADAMAP